MKWISEVVNALPDEEEPEQGEEESEEDHAARVAEFNERYEAEVARKVAEDLNEDGTTKYEDHDGQLIEVYKTYNGEF